MTVRELKDILGRMGDEDTVYICVNTPDGWACPDGAVVGVGGVHEGFDWHTGQVLVVPEYKLDIHDVEAWGGRRAEAINSGNEAERR